MSDNNQSGNNDRQRENRRTPRQEREERERLRREHEETQRRLATIRAKQQLLNEILRRKGHNPDGDGNPPPVCNHVFSFERINSIN